MQLFITLLLVFSTLEGFCITHSCTQLSLFCTVVLTVSYACIIVSFNTCITLVSGFMTKTWFGRVFGKCSTKSHLPNLINKYFSCLSSQFITSTQKTISKSSVVVNEHLWMKTTTVRSQHWHFVMTTQTSASFNRLMRSHKTTTYLWQLSPRSGPCIFWAWSCQFGLGTA